MTILLIEPFFTGSHKKWAEGLQANSEHDIQILSLPGRHWKWRMHGAAVTLAFKFLEEKMCPDLILATDMLDLTTFLALTKSVSANIPTAIYFHENQLTYPWSPTDEDVQLERDNHYSFINYTSALAADKVLFNSVYHKDSFLNALPDFLRVFPDFENFESIKTIAEKSAVLSLGMDLQAMEKHKPFKIEPYPRALLLWNHRWEYDKNPEQFFQALFELKNRGVEYKLVVLGEKTTKIPSIFNEAKVRLKDEIVHFGYADNIKTYSHWLFHADILPVTSIQDFFGGSIIEAMYCNVFPLLPKRLAYPEHLPVAYERTFFYENNRDFVNRLQRLIFDVKLPRSMDIRQYVKQYDWSRIVIQYDSIFDTMS